MLELIKRWAELEPERCRRQPTRYEVLLNGEWVAVDYILNTTAIVMMRDAIIQAAVQEAVAARKWIFSLYIYMPGRFHSILTVPGDKPGDMPWYVRQARGWVAAEVLLDSYVQALEAAR